jgi:hypothetical protein
MASPALGTHDIHHSFSLSQIEPAVEVGTQRELARLSQAPTRTETQLNGPPQRQGATMTMDLSHILAGIGPGRWHVDGQYLVYDTTIGGVDDMPVTHAPRRPVPALSPILRPYHSPQQVEGLGTAKADDADATFPERRPHCNDRVIQTPTHSAPSEWDVTTPGSA